MAGFSLKSKAKGVSKPDGSRPKIGFSFGKTKSPSPQTKTTRVGSVTSGRGKTGTTREGSVASGRGKLQGFDDGSDDDEDGKVVIDTFDSKLGGALANNNAIGVPKRQVPLVITPTTLNRAIRRTAPEPARASGGSVSQDEQKLKYGFNEMPVRSPVGSSQVSDDGHDGKGIALTDEERVRLSLLSGTKVSHDAGLTIPIEHNESLLSSEEEEDSDQYEKVPVEQFGTALLRGMGWKGNDKSSKSTVKPDLEKRQKGALVGIGAKRVENELLDDMMGRNQKISVPVKRRHRETGEVERTRETKAS